MKRGISFCWCLVLILSSMNGAGREWLSSLADVSATRICLTDIAAAGDTTGKQFRPPDPFPVEKQFKIASEDQEHRLLDFRKNDVIRISTKNGLKHYRNKQLLNIYKIIPQLAIITIQPQCRVAPCPPIDTKVLVYYMDHTKRFISIRDNTFLVSDSTYNNADTPTTALRLVWKKAYGLHSK